MPSTRTISRAEPLWDPKCAKIKLKSSTVDVCAVRAMRASIAAFLGLRVACTNFTTRRFTTTPFPGLFRTSSLQRLTWIISFTVQGISRLHYTENKGPTTCLEWIFLRSFWHARNNVSFRRLLRGYFINRDCKWSCSGSVGTCCEVKFIFRYRFDAILKWRLRSWFVFGVSRSNVFC